MYIVYTYRLVYNIVRDKLTYDEEEEEKKSRMNSLSQSQSIFGSEIENAYANYLVCHRTQNNPNRS